MGSNPTLSAILGYNIPMDDKKGKDKEIFTPLEGKEFVVGFWSKSLESYVEFEEKWAEILAKFLTRFFGTLRFLNITLLLSILWIFVNLGIITNLIPFDPYPFSWLMIIIQIFAIVMTIVILINQNRESRVHEVYQKMDFEINVRAEKEITKILHMIEEIHTELGIAKIDKELERMKEKTNLSKIKKDIEEVIKEKDRKDGITITQTRYKKSRIR